MARFGKQGSAARPVSAPTLLMPQRSPLVPVADARLSLGLVIGWGLFMAFALVGLAIALRLGGSVPILLDVTSR